MWSREFLSLATTLLFTEHGARSTDYGLRITDYGLRSTDYGARSTAYRFGPPGTGGLRRRMSGEPPIKGCDDMGTATAVLVVVSPAGESGAAGDVGISGVVGAVRPSSVESNSAAVLGGVAGSSAW
jgi:hypothetical protein